MRRELRNEIKRLAASHIKPVVEERILLETLDSLGEWMGQTVGKVTYEMSDQEIDEVADAIHDAYVKELTAQLKAFPRHKK